MILHFRVLKKNMQLLCPWSWRLHQKLQIYYPRAPLVKMIWWFLWQYWKLNFCSRENKSINKSAEKKLISPALPQQFSKLTEKSEESSKWLFCDLVSESVGNLEKENKSKALLKYKKDSGKRKYPEESSNSRSSSKYQKRTPEYWHNFRGYQPRLQKNKIFQNHQGWKHNSFQTRRWTWVIS